MKKIVTLGIGALLLSSFLAGCDVETTAASKEAQEVNAQQDQYAVRQPVPKFNWSMERQLVSELYQLRNKKAATHSVWRSNYGTIEGDCPSIGFGIPYDTSLTNPLTQDKRWWGSALGSTVNVVEQAEPNGIFASKNTSATWVMCVGTAGQLDPVYVEAKVTTYPYPVTVDYDKNRVIRAGKSSVTINMGQ